MNKTTYPYQGISSKEYQDLMRANLSDIHLRLERAARAAQSVTIRVVGEANPPTSSSASSDKQLAALRR